MGVLSEHYIRTNAPAVYTTDPIGTVSKEYSFVPTSQVISDLEQLGWYPVAAKQQRWRFGYTKKYSRHLIRFRKPEHLRLYASLEERVPEIGLYNGHDGKTRLQIYAGVYELTYGNGYIIPDALFRAVTLVHRHYKFEEVQEMVEQFVESLPDIHKEIDGYKQIILNMFEKRDFALKASSIRWPKGKNMTLFFADGLLTPNVPSCDNNDLWTVFQNVQNNLMKGGVNTGRRSKPVKVKGKSVKRIIRTRKLESVKEYIRVNKALWELVINTMKIREIKEEAG